MLAQCNKIVYYKLRLQKGRCVMDFTVIILVFIIILQLAVIFMLYRSRAGAVDEKDLAELVRHFEATERRMYEGLRDLRSEQATLARAARMENQSAADRLSEQLDKRFDRIGESTEKNLEQIRIIVDEKLNSTLERRLGESFSLVSRRLEEVHRGLGEMQSLAGGIGDLKRILSNVKNRGIWGEMQLGALLEQALTSSQYARNVAVVPGENVAVKPSTSERVEFALKLPGKSEQTVWLPVDAKFPQEDYQRLLAARENADAAAAEAALKQLEKRFKSEAADINSKYICPPYSTDFAVMYLPTEGLFAEAVNITGLLEELQRKYRVCVAGPTTLAALLNSLQVGFRTLAIEKRTGEVWRIIAGVKQDFAVFAALLDKTRKKLQEASGHIEAAERRSRVINKKLYEAESFETDLKMPEQNENGLFSDKN